MIIKPKFRKKKEECHKLIVPKEVCYIQFGKQRKGKYAHSIDGVGKLEFYTQRGEMFIIDFNKKNEIIGIELLDSPNCRKPCLNYWKKKK